jgi:hypothetical protein
MDNIAGVTNSKKAQSLVSLSTQEKIDIVMKNFSEFLKEKNRRYGDSALNPKQIFSQIPASEQLKNRLDDKLSRIETATRNGQQLKKNDVADVLGYIVLILIQNNWLEFEDLLD